MHRILLELLGPQWRPRQVCFTHRPPANLDSHRQLFGTMVEFNSAFNGIVCAAKDLAARLPTTSRACRPTPAAFSTKPSPAHPAPPRTRRANFSAPCCLAAAAPPTRWPSCSAWPGGPCIAICRQKTRSSRRYCGRSAPSLPPADCATATRSLAEMAELLGFAAPSPFAFWFRQHFGCTVSQWRRAAAATTQDTR